MPESSLGGNALPRQRRIIQTTTDDVFTSTGHYTTAETGDKANEAQEAPGTPKAALGSRGKSQSHCMKLPLVTKSRLLDIPYTT